MANIGILSFNAGELSPQIDARTDVDKYNSGCRVLENMIPLIYGGAERRPGTKFITKKMPMYSEIVDFLVYYENDLVSYENNAVFIADEVIPKIFNNIVFYENESVFYEGELVTSGEIIYHDFEICSYENNVVGYENEVVLSDI